MQLCIYTYIKNIVLNYVCMCVCVYARKCRCLRRLGVADSPGAAIREACSWMQSCLPSHGYHLFQGHHCSAKMSLFKSSWLLLSHLWSPSCGYCNSAMILSSLHTWKPIGLHLISRVAKTEHLRSKQGKRQSVCKGEMANINECTKTAKLPLGYVTQKGSTALCFHILVSCICKYFLAKQTT